MMVCGACDSQVGSRQQYLPSAPKGRTNADPTICYLSGSGVDDNEELPHDLRSSAETLFQLKSRFDQNMCICSTRLTHTNMTTKYQQLTPPYAQGIIARSFARAQCLIKMFYVGKNFFSTRQTFILFFPGGSEKLERDIAVE